MGVWATCHVFVIIPKVPQISRTTLIIFCKKKRLRLLQWLAQSRVPHLTLLLRFPLWTLCQKKDSTDCRVIVDWGGGGGGGISRDCLGDPIHLWYPSVDNLVNMVRCKGHGCCLFKCDLTHAYRQLPLDPGDLHHLGYRWRGDLFVDATLMMGLQSVAFLCQGVTNAITYIAKNKGVSISNYLDDFAGVEVNGSATEAWHSEAEWFGRIPSKGMLAQCVHGFLGNHGWHWTNGAGGLSGQAAGAVQAAAGLDGEGFSYQETDAKPGGRPAVCGHLCQARPNLHGQAFEFSLQLPPNWGNAPYQTISGPTWDCGWHSSHTIMGFRSSLRSFGQIRMQCLHVMPVSLGQGWFQGQYFHTAFPAFIQALGIHIDRLEMLTLTVALKVWGRFHSGKKVTMLSGNLSAVVVIQIGRARDTCLPVRVGVLQARWKCQIRVQHIRAGWGKLTPWFAVPLGVGSQVQGGIIRQDPGHTAKGDFCIWGAA